MFWPALAGNLAIQRRLKGQVLFTPWPDALDALRATLTATGAWREYAAARLRPELPSAPMLQVPAGLLPDMPDLEPRRRSDEFIVSRDAYSLTIIHPGSESRVRVVAKNYRYSPEQRGGPVPTPEPGEVPAISYNLIAPSDTDAAQVLIATGPGAFVEMDEPVPLEGAREENLQEEWEHGGRPARLGHFDLTIVEAPDNALVPLPNEPIDVAALLAAGGHPHSPDRRTWRGAVTYEERVMTIGMIIAELAMIALPLALEALEAVQFARAASALSESGAPASTALEASALRLTTAVTDEIPSVAGEVGEVASPSVAGARGAPTLADTPLNPPKTGWLTTRMREGLVNLKLGLTNADILPTMEVGYATGPRAAMVESAGTPRPLAATTGPQMDLPTASVGTDVAPAQTPATAVNTAPVAGPRTALPTASSSSIAAPGAGMSAPTIASAQSEAQQRIAVVERGQRIVTESAQIGRDAIATRDAAVLGEFLYPKEVALALQGDARFLGIFVEWRSRYMFALDPLIQPHVGRGGYLGERYVIGRSDPRRGFADFFGTPGGLLSNIPIEITTNRALASHLGRYYLKRGLIFTY